ncbi:hypothetical protein GLOTRDRAFT_138333 [Gloeophyllum trabeum ATCC 11539]|uniref:Phosphatidate phosphatase APP1 catalytic domain-containing protein n=1 Tax=Gloeophyllum trabeum (strain ATCC 11539 / FP-39264 / Madison 617) TaxID=670483 RepID=S7Q9S0_GLOTA|nr:uncharacterized protein GLOTRDRAFT_138333 [Gloeophyllum trabeum ATCC 11539]EPQ56666.1 hypothetical protein GLOTRDRAFT_138333 [Gloeophyllum trabeum ATCC 11539]
MSDSAMSKRSLLSSALSKLSNARTSADLKNALPGRRDLRPGENGYVDGEGKKQSWRQWAGEKIKGRGGNVVTAERISLFPGWATRRYREGDSYGAFDIHVSIAGFAVSHRPPEYATRAQRAFLRMARGFAALPKLPGQIPSDNVSEPSLSAVEQELLGDKRLPPTPSDIPDDYEVQALEASMRLVTIENEQRQNEERESSEDAYREGSLDPVDSPASVVSSFSSSSSFSSTSSDANSLSDAVRKMHANLEARLEPFWTTALTGRVVRISVYTSPISDMQHGTDNNNADVLPTPLMTQDALTGPDGAFQSTVVIPWSRICAYALQKALSDTSKEHEFFVRTELLPPPPPQANLGSGSPMAHFTPNPGYRARYIESDLPASATHVPLTHSPVRVISDVDDTVKLSSILSGARAVFYNVFVKELEDVVIPAPATRKRAGVVEILSAFPDSQFILVGDTGEQDLELYAAVAAERPTQILAIFVRDATVDDSAEPVDDPTGQNAKAIFTALDRNPTVKPTRGARTPGLAPLSAVRPLPSRGTSENISPSSATPTPRATRGHSVDQQAAAAADATDYFTSNTVPSDPVFTSTLSAEPENAPSMSSSSTTSSASSSRRSSRAWMPGSSRQNSMNYAVSEAERKRQELQMRIWRARREVPQHIRLRVFRRPEECVEAFEILGRLEVHK